MLERTEQGLGARTHYLETHGDLWIVWERARRRWRALKTLRACVAAAHFAGRPDAALQLAWHVHALRRCFDPSAAAWRHVPALHPRRARRRGSGAALPPCSSWRTGSAYKAAARPWPAASHRPPPLPPTDRRRCLPAGTSSLS